MKFSKLVCATVFSAMLLLSVVSASPFDDAVAYWNFDQGSGTTLTDVTGNGNDGILVDGPTWTVGQRGGALDFDGIDDAVDLGNLDLGGNDGLTISAWYFADNLDNGDVRVISKSISSGNNLWLLSERKDKLRFRLRTDAGVTHTVVGSSMDVGQWVHFLGTYDGTDMKIYKNGVQVTSRARSGTVINDPTVGAGIGVNPPIGTPFAGGFFDGRLDEIAAWDRGLSVAEVLEVYNAGFAPLDNSSPSVPQNLSGVAMGENNVSLTWVASFDPESGVSSYNIYRDNVQVATSLTSSFVDTGLAQNTAYDYEVSAVNGANLESARSNLVTVTTDADVTAPTVVFAESGNNFVNITFSEVVDQTTAEDESNYALSGGVTVVSAIKTGPSTVTLVTTAHNEHSVTVMGVEDLGGNAANDSANYTPFGCFL